MGLFGKIKNILFEDDEELVEDMPVYTKKDVEEKKEEVTSNEPVEEKPIETSETTTFHNVKRDVYMPFEDDVLDEIPSSDSIPEVAKTVEPELPALEPVVEEKKSPFLSFDEDEFTRLNSRVNRNEARSTREVKKVDDLNAARKANNNFSSTTPTSTFTATGERVSINSGTLVTGKKPFTPSPVISPVYGILGENYKKDDIVDKRNGMKRERVVKPIISHVVTEEEIEAKNEEIKKEEPIKVNIDTVRLKAYGSLDKMEEDAQKEIEQEEPTIRELPIEPRKKEEKVVVELPKEEPKQEEVKVEEPVQEPKIEEPKVEEVSIEDQIEIEEPLDVSKILDDDDKIDEMQESSLAKEKKEERKEVKPKKLDELEKTSTLQILDDIEKELNSIKPITKNREEEEKIIEEEPVQEKTMKEKLENNDTLENDLFNLIDSMYEEGEEEDNG